jgi:hypothetical protein
MNGTTKEPVTKFETITPEMAKELLANSVQGRAKSAQTVRRYALAMKLGRFYSDNAQTVGIDTNGVLVDGHTRMAAVVEAGIPVRFNVARGVAPGSYHMFDRGQKRTAAHGLAALGIPQANYIGGAGRSLNFYIFTGALPPCSGGSIASIPDYQHECGLWLYETIGETKIPSIIRGRLPFVRKVRPSPILAMFAIAAFGRGVEWAEWLAVAMAGDEFRKNTLGWAVRNAMLRAADADRSSPTQSRHIQSMIDVINRGPSSPCKLYRPRTIEVGESIANVDFNDLRAVVMHKAEQSA